jgi:hypothetical protein
MKSIWQDATRREVATRLAQLTPERRAEWGRMSAQQMVCHLAASVQMAIGERICAPKRTPLRFPIVKHLVIYVLPFPKSVPTAPELIVAATPNAWARDVGDLQAALDRFIARGPEARWVDHPTFGRLSAGQWGVLVYRHVDHHLRQFGV